MSEHSSLSNLGDTSIHRTIEQAMGITVDSPRAGGQYSITGRAVVILQSRDENP